MLQLPNNCKCSGDGPAASPKNFRQLKSLPLGKNGKPKPWRLHYRFYDPKLPYPVEVSIKGMNDFTTLAERKKITEEMLIQEINMLKEGYHPFHKKMVNGSVEDGAVGIDANTPFFEALAKAHESLDTSSRTKQEIKSNLYYLQFAIQKLQYQFISIKDIRRKHIKALLNKMAQIKHTIPVNMKGKERKAERWTNNTFNQYRKNLSILFEELIEAEATELNPVHGIKRKKHAPAKREVLSTEQCEIVDDYARKYDTGLWILLNCFYTSGARESEIFRLQGEHVNLEKQMIKYLVLKGENFEWVERPIVDASLPFWKYAMRESSPKDYVFSKGLRPGPIAINPIQFTRRWRRHIKKKLNIDCDLYALKHLNITKNVDAAMEKINEAQDIARQVTGHKSGKMIAKVYDIKSVKRLNDEVKISSSGLR